MRPSRPLGQEKERPQFATGKPSALALRQQSPDLRHGFAPLLRHQFHDARISLAVAFVLEPLLIALVDAVLISPARDGTAGAPEFEILAQIVGVDAFADQLRVTNDFIKARF